MATQTAISGSLHAMPRLSGPNELEAGDFQDFVSRQYAVGAIVSPLVIVLVPTLAICFVVRRAIFALVCRRPGVAWICGVALASVSTACVIGFHQLVLRSLLDSREVVDGLVQGEIASVLDLARQGQEYVDNALQHLSAFVLACPSIQYDLEQVGLNVSDVEQRLEDAKITISDVSHTVYYWESTVVEAYMLFSNLEPAGYAMTVTACVVGLLAEATLLSATARTRSTAPVAAMLFAAMTASVAFTTYATVAVVVSDFCHDPGGTLVRLSGDGDVGDQLTFYLECDGRNPLGEAIADGNDALAQIRHDLAFARPLVRAYCPDGSIGPFDAIVGDVAATNALLARGERLLACDGMHPSVEHLVTRNLCGARGPDIDTSVINSTLTAAAALSFASLCAAAFFGCSALLVRRWDVLNLELVKLRTTAADEADADDGVAVLHGVRLERSSSRLSFVSPLSSASLASSSCSVNGSGGGGVFSPGLRAPLLAEAPCPKVCETLVPPADPVTSAPPFPRPSSFEILLRRRRSAGSSLRSLGALTQARAPGMPRVPLRWRCYQRRPGSAAAGLNASLFSFRAALQQSHETDDDSQPEF